MSNENIIECKDLNKYYSTTSAKDAEAFNKYLKDLANPPVDDLSAVGGFAVTGSSVN